MNIKKNIPQTSVIGASGEYLVLSTLLKHNFIAGKAPDNTKDYDLVVINKDGTSKTMLNEPGIPEMEMLYYDVYDYNTGKFTSMSPEMKEQYKN